jgi:hypothetical protein
MTKEHDWLIDRYRASAEDIPASDLDQTILSAARRHCAVRRGARRARILLMLAGFVATAVSIVLRPHPLGIAQSRSAEYGKSEGIARSYLLNTSIPDVSAAGIAEGTP